MRSLTKMNLKIQIFHIGLATILFLLINFTDGLSKYYARIPAQTLAARTGAAHFEEHFEIIPKHIIRKRASNEDYDYEVYQGVVGRPGIDFPILPRIPQTSFSCRTFGNGYFADLETDCQVFHICEEGRKISFLCPNGTIFQQSELTCDWWFKVNCAGSPRHYAESSESLYRAQNKGKQKEDSKNNKFHSDEREYSHERFKNKNQLATNSKHQSQSSNRNKLNRRLDSDEIPSTENFDFDDVISREHTNSKLKVKDSTDETQVLSASSSFVKGRNGNNRKNGYTYNNPNNKKSNEKQENNNNYKSTNLIINSGTNIPAANTGKPDLIQRPATSKAKSLKSTPYYTPTVPSLLTKTPEATTEKYSKTQPTKSRGNLGFSFGSSTKSPFNSYTKSATTPATKTKIIGHRGNNAKDPTFNINNFSEDLPPLAHSKQINSKTTFKDNLDVTTSSFAEYSRYVPTTERSLYTTSTSGPTYLPKKITSTLVSQGNKSFFPFKSEEDVSDHVKEMVRTINDLKYNMKVNTKKLNEDMDVYLGKSARPGLHIPPSSGPNTIASLANYFAGENDTFSKIPATINAEPTEKFIVAVKSDISSGNLSNKTIQKYENLFGLRKSLSKPAPNVSLLQKMNSHDENDLEGQHSSGLIGDNIGKPETRKIAQVFTNALSAYLEDPDQFRQILTEVRPTEPPSSEYLDITAAPATYRRPKISNQIISNGKTANAKTTLTSNFKTSTSIPTTTLNKNDDFEVLNYSDDTFTNNKKQKNKSTTSYLPLPTTAIPKFIDRVPASRIITKTDKNISTTTIEPNDIAMEVNKELESSTIKSILLTSDLQSGEIDATTFSPNKFRFSSLSQKTTTAKSPVISSIKIDNTKKFNRIGKLNVSSNIINEAVTSSTNTLSPFTISSDITSTSTENSVEKTTQFQWNQFAQTSYLDPLTINDGLVNEFKTTTTVSPFTYLPKIPNKPTRKPTASTTESSPERISLKGFKNDIETFRTGKTLVDFPNLSDDLLPPQEGMKQIAVKMFGGLNDTQANHLMNVMQKAESNQVVRKLILLLVQTCDDDYGKTVEKSRKALLNALIDMDGKYEFDDEVEIIKLKPRAQKSIGSSRRANLIQLTTPKIEATTYRRSLDLLNLRSSTIAPSTSRESTTRFQIRVEEPDIFTAESQFSTIDSDISTTTLTPDTTTYLNFISTDLPKVGNRRKAKDLERVLSQEEPLQVITLNSHKNSDERALELLKSLYSLASKFGKR